MTVFIGTEQGVVDLDRPDSPDLDGHSARALVRDEQCWWAIADGTEIVCRPDGGDWTVPARVETGRATCLLPRPDGLLVGTTGAHLLRLEGSALVPVEGLDHVDGRDTWYTPWGAPPDTRSLAAAGDALLASIHVGGVARSTDGGRNWHPTIDVDADVHEVRAHPARPDLAVTATAVGFARSDDAGATWKIDDRGLHATYLRAVAIAGDMVLVSASTGPQGTRSALYRRPLDADVPFERCRDGLPEWCTDNIDTGCLAAADELVVFADGDGSVYVSHDAGLHWSRTVENLAPVRSVCIG